METITNFLHQGVSFVVPFVILLGLLIFVHELGHFLVAKFFKVRVEVFSLGFGKKIFRVTKGATDYCLSVIPFGGYVKMYGDEPGSDVPENRKNESFNHKPVGQRIAIVLAGPLMNFFFAILLFVCIALLGESFVVPNVGDVPAGSAAAEAGFHDGDAIISVAGKPVRSWDEVKKVEEESAGRPIAFEVKRQDGTTVQINATPKEVVNKNILSSKEFVGDIEGLSFLSKASVVGVSNPKSPAALAGVQAGDIVRTVNGLKTDNWRDFIVALEKGIGAREYNLEIQRGEDEQAPLLRTKVSLPASAKVKVKSGNEVLGILGMESADFYIDKVLDDSAASSAGLKRGDKIVAAEGQVLTEWEGLVKKVEAAGSTEHALKLTLLRSGEVLNVELKPKKIKQMNSSGKEEEMFAVGVMRMLAYANPGMTVVKASGLGEALKIGVDQSVHWTKTTVLSFLRIVQNRVSAKSIGGPLMIGQLASETFKVGMSPFMKIMAIISLNLFVLNLLPVPVLDGGHLVFYLVELVRGAPLSLKKMEFLQQVGLVLLLALMVFALFNDVTRMLKVPW